MNSAIKSEQEDSWRLRKAVEFLAFCREAENQARRNLAAATDRTKLAKEKHETLFVECEKRAVARRKAGLIEVTV